MTRNVGYREMRTPRSAPAGSAFRCSLVRTQSPGRRRSAAHSRWKTLVGESYQIENPCHFRPAIVIIRLQSRVMQNRLGAGVRVLGVMLSWVVFFSRICPMRIRHASSAVQISPERPSFGQAKSLVFNRRHYSLETGPVGEIRCCPTCGRSGRGRQIGPKTAPGPVFSLRNAFAASAGHRGRLQMLSKLGGPKPNLDKSDTLVYRFIKLYPYWPEPWHRTSSSGEPRARR